MSRRPSLIAADLAICSTCGANYSQPVATPPDACIICEDPRQWVPETGQEWTSFGKLESSGMQTRLLVDPLDERMFRIQNEPAAAIGQTPILVLGDTGSLIWDSSAFMSRAAVNEVADLIRARGIPWHGIAISHPHFYTSSCTIFRLLEAAIGPKLAHSAHIYVSKADQQWWTHSKDTENVVFVEEEVLAIGDRFKMIRCGGHFEGSSLLLWDRSNEQAEPRTTVGFTSDTIMITPAFKTAFMWSFPNMIPMPPKDIEHIWHTLRPFEFDVLMGGWPGKTIKKEGKARVKEGCETTIAKMGHDVTAFDLSD